MISVLILTKNEESDLPGCLESVSWSDDVFVFDSFSTDGTAEIARGRGVNFVQRKFDGYSKQRNAALDELPFRHDWIFILDADERPTPQLVEEMRKAASAVPNGVDGYRMRRSTPRYLLITSAWYAAGRLTIRVKSTRSWRSTGRPANLNRP